MVTHKNIICLPGTVAPIPTFRATVLLDSPALSGLRAVLHKQKLEWQEEGVLIEGKAAVSIYVVGFRYKTKRVPAPRKAKPKAKDYTCKLLEYGKWEWTRPDGTSAGWASFPHDPKRLAKISAETRARENRELNKPMGACAYKAEIFESRV